MDWATIKVPVPREWLVKVGATETDEQQMVMHPRLMGRFPLKLGDTDLGEWHVVSVEITMQPTTIQAVNEHVLAGRAVRTTAVLPTYWATLSRALP